MVNAVHTENNMLQDDVMNYIKLELKEYALLRYPRNRTSRSKTVLHVYLNW